MKSITLLLLFISALTTAQTVKSYVVIADTSSNYFELEEKMEVLSKTLKQKIDLRERIYNKEENLICLPLDNDDVLYVGSYYPRRFESNNTISIEYLNYYDNISTEKLMAIVTLITDDKKEAKEKLIELKKLSKPAFLIKTEIYIGCMH